jgi:hypothetical protein
VEIIIGYVGFIVIFLVLLLLRIFGITFLPRHLLGKKVMRIPHIIVNKNEQERSLTHAWKNYIIHKFRNQKGSKIKLICGESTDTETFKFALENGLDVELVCGPNALNNKYKDDLLNLRRNYSNDQFRVYISKERPVKHVTIIETPKESNLMLDDAHEPMTEKYNESLVIEGASKEFKSKFDKIFEDTRSQGKLANEEDIKNLKILDDSNDRCR